MAANDERTKQIINARNNNIRNQAKVLLSPDRAKPQSKSAPNPILKITDPLVMVAPPVNDAPEKNTCYRCCTKKPKGIPKSNTKPKVPPIKTYTPTK